MTVDEVLKEICMDEIFFFHSGGGVTISGGEVLMQIDFAQEVLREYQQYGIAAAIETSLFADFTEIEKILPYLNSMYIDFKIFDEDKHIFYTGVSNHRIKDNLKKLDQVYEGAIYIRIPTVPTVNMTEDNMRKTAEFLSQLSHIRNVKLLPYHRLGLDTYHKMNRVYELKGIETPSMEDMRKMVEVFKEVNSKFIVKIKGELFKQN